MEDSAEGSIKRRRIALKKDFGNLKDELSEHRVDARIVVGVFQRMANIVVPDFIKQNLAFFYIWIPLALMVLSYFFAISHSFLIVGGYTALAMALILTLYPNKLHATNNLIFWLFVAYVLMITGSITMLSSNALLSFWFLFAYVVLPFLIGVTFVNRVIWRHVLLSFYLLIIVLFFVFGENILTGVGQRAYVFGSQANSVQLSLVCAFVFSFVFSGSQHGRIKFLILLIFVFLGGLISGIILPRWFLLATFLILFASIYFWNSHRIGGVLIFAFIAGWIVALFFSDDRASFYTENMLPQFASIEGPHDAEITSIEERIRFVFTGFQLFLSNPFYGVGAGNYGIASGGTVNSFPHLSMIHVLTEMGVFVLILYIAMLGYGGFILISAIKINPAHFPWLAIFLYGIAFSLLHGNYLTDKLIYMALGYASSLGLRLKEI